MTKIERWFIMLQNTEMSGILGTLLISVFGTIISIISYYTKKLINRYLDDGTKRKIAGTVVSAVEQLYSDLNGPEKYNKAVHEITELLDQRGITIGELEIKMLIEAAVNDLHSNLLTSEIIEASTDVGISPDE